MRKIRYLTLLLLAMLTGVEVAAQSDFNPVSPDEPGVPTQRLMLVASPAEGGSVSGGGKYVPETAVSVTASANTNWQFVNWTDEDGNVLSTSRTYKHTKQARRETLTANFTYNPGSPADPVPGTTLVYHKLTVLAAEGGTASGGGKYQPGTTVNLRATCNTGYTFVGWVNEDGEVVSTAASFAYTTLEFAETLTATFKFNPSSPTDPSDPILRHHVRVTATDGGTASGTTFALQGTAVNLRAYVNTGYSFVGWYLNGELYTTLLSFNYTIGTENADFEARFKFNPANPADPSMPLDGHYSMYWMSCITYPGKDVESCMYLTNFAPLNDMHFDLTFPEGLTPDIDHIQLSAAMNGYTVSIAEAEAEEENAYTVTLLGGTVAVGNQEVFRVHIAVPEATALGTDYQLKINQVSVAQEDGTTCTMRTRNGRISIYKLGDTNGDGEVDILDRVNLVDFIGAGSANDDSFIIEVSDINDDGVYDILDVVGVTDIISNE